MSWWHLRYYLWWHKHNLLNISTNIIHLPTLRNTYLPICVRTFYLITESKRLSCIVVRTNYWFFLLASTMNWTRSACMDLLQCLNQYTMLSPYMFVLRSSALILPGGKDKLLYMPQTHCRHHVMSQTAFQLAKTLWRHAMTERDLIKVKKDLLWQCCWEWGHVWELESFWSLIIFKPSSGSWIFVHVSLANI